MTHVLRVQVPNGVLAAVAPTVLRVAPGGLILINGVWCGATVTTTDTIHVTSPQAAETAFRLVIDLGGGPFAPGATDEPGTSDEIEMDVDMSGTFLSLIRVVGSDGADYVVAGTDGAFPAGVPSINLNADEAVGDADVRISMSNPVGEIASVELDGGMGDDVLSLAGGAGTGAFLYPAGSSAGLGASLVGGSGNDILGGGLEDMTLVGGDGDDTFIGGPDGDTFVGGAGIDVVDYSLRVTPVFADADGQPGDDGAAGEGDSIAADIEDIAGGGGSDVLSGNPLANSFWVSRETTRSW